MQRSNHMRYAPGEEAALHEKKTVRQGSVPSFTAFFQDIPCFPTQRMPSYFTDR